MEPIETGMQELVSTHAQILITNLLNVHALASMYRSSDNPEYFTGAANWLPALERSFVALKSELERGVKR